MYGFPRGSPREVPWVWVFDPALNIRALGEIRLGGFGPSPRSSIGSYGWPTPTPVPTRGVVRFSLATGILLVAEEYFEHAFAGAEPGPDLDFLRALVPYVWARWR